MAVPLLSSTRPSPGNFPFPPPHTSPPLENMCYYYQQSTEELLWEASGTQQQSYVVILSVPGTLAFEALDHHRKKPFYPEVATQRGHVPGFQSGGMSSSHSSPDARHVCKKSPVWSHSHQTACVAADRPLCQVLSELENLQCLFQVPRS